MHLAFVTDFPSDPAFPRGGVQAVSVNLLRALLKFDDFKISVVTENDSIKSYDSLDWNGLKVFRLPRKGRNMLTNAIGPGRNQMYRFLSELKPDVIHAHDIYGLMVQDLDIPRVFTAHGQIFKDTLVSGGNFSRIRSLLWRYFEIAGWKRQPHIISISPYVREQMSNLVNGTIHDIDNPIGYDSFGVDRHENSMTIFSAGIINARKNVLSLLEAVAILKKRGLNIKLRLAGGHERNYYKKVIDYIEQQKLSGSVMLLGQISSAAIIHELSCASLFALVSLEENSPMVIEEAMAASVPVITSSRCGMPYMVRDGESGYLIHPQRPEDIADKIQKLLENDELRKSMGQKSKEIALDRFHPDKVAKRTRDVYLQAVCN